MRVFFSLVASAVSLSLVACSGGTEDTTLRRSPGAPARSPAPSSGTTTSGDTASNTAPSPSPPAEPPPSTDAGPGAPAPPTTPAPGSCGAPKCFGLAGIGGCKATDAAGVLVTMGCQDGACVCLTGALTTATFDGDVGSADDARQLFLANCDCN